jgi:hypothetical protein
MRMRSWSALTLVWAGVVGLALTGCGEEGGARDHGSGRIVDKELAVTGFTGVRVSFGVHADITVGEPERVVLRGDDNLLERLQPKVVQGQLVLQRDALWEQNPPTPTEPLRLTVVTPRFNRLQASAGARARAVGVDSADFALDVSSGAQVALAGEAGRLSLEASSQGDADLRELVLQELHVAASSGARVHANVTGAVSGELSSGARLVCEGQPEVRLVSTSSGSDVNYP